MNRRELTRVFDRRAPTDLGFACLESCNNRNTPTRWLGNGRGCLSIVGERHPASVNDEGCAVVEKQRNEHVKPDSPVERAATYEHLLVDQVLALKSNLGPFCVVIEGVELGNQLCKGSGCAVVVRVDASNFSLRL